MKPTTELGERLSTWLVDGPTAARVALANGVAVEVVMRSPRTEYARAIGVQPRTLSLLIAGATTPSLETLTMLAAFADVTEGVIWNWSRNDSSGQAFESGHAHAGRIRGAVVPAERRREISSKGWYASLNARLVLLRAKRNAKRERLERGQMPLPLEVG